MELAALIISILAFVAPGLLAWRALTLSRHSNTLPVLIDLFREHRSDRLADARAFVFFRLGEHDLSQGLGGLAAEDQTLVRELAWFYDNLGALVTHGVVDLAPVSGYLGQSVIQVWERVQPLVAAERQKRGGSVDAQRWQVYFENLYRLVLQLPPAKARESQHLWLLAGDTQRVGGNSRRQRSSMETPIT